MSLTPSDQALDPDRNPDDRAFLDTIQGNILKPNGRPFVRLLLFRFLDNVAADELQKIFFAASLARDSHRFPLVTSAGQQWIDARSGDKARPFYGFGITLLGMQRCGYAGADLPYWTLDRNHLEDGDDQSVGFGRPVTKTWQQLDQPPHNDNTYWDPIYRTNDGPHGVWLLAHEYETGPQSLAQMQADVVAFLRGHHVDVANLVPEDGFTWTDADGKTREPFGFVDGISHPQFFAGPAYDEQSPWVKISRDRVLLNRDASDQRSRHNGGSFLVLRKLEQNVQAFRAFEATVQTAVAAAGLNAPAGGLLIGRDRDGTPLGTGRGPGGGFDPGKNQFDFLDAQNNQEASRCPFHAHIRKANPRGPAGQPNPQRALFARRSYVYDTNKNQLPPSGTMPGAQAATYVSRSGGVIEKDVGLLFMGYMCNIAAQFVRMQSDWFANPAFPANGTGFGDAVLRPLGLAGSRPWTWQPGGANGPQLSLPPPAATALPIMPKGGAYFYVPSISWLRRQQPVSFWVKVWRWLLHLDA